MLATYPLTPKLLKIPVLCRLNPIPSERPQAAKLLLTQISDGYIFCFGLLIADWESGSLLLMVMIDDSEGGGTPKTEESKFLPAQLG